MIELERRGAVAVISMTNGENLFNRASLERWHEILDELAAETGPLAVVTTGTGKFYSNGLDLDWLRARSRPWDDLLAEVHRLFGRILGFPAITLAAINGHAFAGGAVLAAAHDVRIMREDRGYWCLNEVDIGLSLSDPMLEVLGARLPWSAVQQATLTGRRFTATDALQAGIITATAASDGVLSGAIEYAESMLTKHRRVIARHKKRLFEHALTACGCLPAGANDH